MHVLHVSTERGLRGGERQLLALVDGLGARGVRQGLLVRPGAALVAEAGRRGVPVRVQRLGGAFTLVAARRLARHVRREGIDVLHLHTANAHTLGVLARFAVRGVSRPRVVVSRNVAYSIHRHGLPGWSRWKYGRRVDRIVCVSEAVRRRLVEDGVPEHRLAVVHAGVDVGRFAALEGGAALREGRAISPRAHLLATVASLTPEKGHAHLLDAVATLARDEVHLALAGAGPLEGDLRARAERLGVERRVHFLGTVPDVRPLLDATDVYVQPSVEEGLSLSLVEALAAGRPAIATTAGGMPEIVTDGEHGLLVPPGDATALAHAIRRLLGDDALSERLAAAGRARVAERFTAERMVEETLALYRPASSTRRR